MSAMDDLGARIVVDPVFAESYYRHLANIEAEKAARRALARARAEGRRIVEGSLDSSKECRQTCTRASGKKCRCACGGHRHGIERFGSAPFVVSK